MMYHRKLSAVLAAFLLFAACMAAQLGRGTILGTVTDSSGAVIGNVGVTITNVDTNVRVAAIANETGFYTAPGLPVGRYSVTVEHPGFKKFVRSGITLLVDQRAQVNVALEVGEVRESVEVIGEAALAETATGTYGKVIENRRVIDLPLNGRSAFALMFLTPGIKSTAGPTNSGFGDRGLELSSVSINGGPGTMNGVYLDGGTNVMSYIGDVNVTPSAEAVEEFKVQSGTMSAEYGFTAGGVVNMVTKSGTNQLHGTVYHFLRNDKLDARNSFAESRPVFRYNQFGASAGGPVRKDRTFFFANWEEYRFRRAFPVIETMPTVLQRQGNFTDLLDRSGNLIALYDPDTTRVNPSGSGFIRDRFPGNILPRNRMDPVALNAQNFYPLPNRTPSDPFTNANNYQILSRNSRQMRQYTTKIDHRFSDRNNLTGRFTFFQHQTDSGSTGPPAFSDPVVAFRDDDLQNRNFILTDVHTFSPTLINEFRLSVARSYFVFEPRSYGGGWPQKLGLPDSHPPEVIPRFNNGLPLFNSANVGYRNSHNWDFYNAVTKIRGSHTMKFGAQYRINRGFNQNMGLSGQFNFSTALTNNPQAPQGTGSAYASFLLGAVSSASINTYLGQSVYGNSWSFFFQDDWKVTRRFTLNLGLRYDYQEVPFERNGGNTNFDPFGINPETGLQGRTVYAGRDGQPRTFVSPDKNDIAPRFGFAWDIFGTGKSVVRGGYAVFYPYMFISNNFGSTAGFGGTATQYNPPGNNANFPAFQLSSGLPSPPIQPLGAALGPSVFLSQSVSYQESNGRTPISQQYTLSIQHAIPGNWLLDATYSANLGRKMISGPYDMNQLDPQYLSLGLALQDRVPNPYAGRVPGTLGAATITREQSLRPFPYYLNINVLNPHLGNYNSHSMLLSAERRMAKGLTMLVSYTAGKVISDSVRAALNFGSVEQVDEIGYQNGKFNRRAERSIDPIDVSQRMVISAVYELPFGKDKAYPLRNRVMNALFGNWQVNTIGTMQSGLPQIVRGANNNRADRPNSTGNSAKLDSPAIGRWFDTDQFVNPPPFTFGNIGRVLPDVRTPGTHSWDLSLIRHLRFGERVGLQFRAEAFNFLNRVNLLPAAASARTGRAQFVPGPGGRNVAGEFGVITGARDARIVQFGLKLSF